LERRLTLEGQVPGGRTGEASEKHLNATTNLEGGEERQKKVSSYAFGSTGFDLIIPHRNFVSLDSCAANGARFPLETLRSRFDDPLCQGLVRVGEMEEYRDEGP
jgi:hypothetical protein